jgi:hypothetical protein
MLTRGQLLTHIVEALEARVDGKVFKPTRKSEYFAHWVSETSKTEPVSDELHFGLAILALSTSQSSVFGDNLILIKNQ